MLKKSRLIISTIIGGAIGSVIGVLLAPQKGSELRKEAQKFNATHKKSIREKIEHLIAEIKKSV